MALSDAISLVQTIVLTATLVALILQLRKQTQVMRHEALSSCRAEYALLVRMMITHKELSKVYDKLGSVQPGQVDNWHSYSEEERLVYHYLELNYELFERVFVLHKRGWIDSVEWKSWEVWLKELSSHPLFCDVRRDNTAMFSSDYETYIDQRLSESGTS